MAISTLTVRINYVDPDVKFATTPADYITLDLTNDYLIWTEGDAVVKTLMTAEPTPTQLNAAATIIDPLAAKTVAKCLLMDSSALGGYYTRLVQGMGLDKKFVFCFSFDAPTATEPQLEAWDTTAHATHVKNVLGLTVPANSMVKGVCTTTDGPGALWVGTSLSGDLNFLLLNDGSGALITAKDLYANLKIVIPAAYATPASEAFVFTIRYNWF